MFKGKRIGVVVPAYNEEALIGRTIDSVPDFVDTVIVVDDASQDATSQHVEEREKNAPDRIVLLKHERNQGVGGAIATGYLWCRDNGIDIAAVMAGDAQMDPADLPRLLKPVADGKADYAKGNRLISGEAYQMIPKVRYFGNAILSLLTKIASGYWQVADSQTGYTAINQKALRTIDWTRMYKRYGQPNDLLVRLNVHNFRVCDVEVKPVYNVGEKSGIKVRKAVFTIGSLLLRRFFWRLKEKYIVKDFHPLVFFYGLAIMMMLVNFAFFLRLVYLWSLRGAVPEITFLIWLFTFTMGLTSSFFAMLFDMETNRHLTVILDPDDEPPGE